MNHTATERALMLTTSLEIYSQGTETHIHHPAHGEKANSWLSMFIWPSIIDSVECRFHLGIYVINRKTNKK
jgi:hypothetical protein